MSSKLHGLGSRRYRGRPRQTIDRQDNIGYENEVDIDWDVEQQTDNPGYRDVIQRKFRSESKEFIWYDSDEGSSCPKCNEKFSGKMNDHCPSCGWMRTTKSSKHQYNDNYRGRSYQRFGRSNRNHKAGSKSRLSRKYRIGRKAVTQANDHSSNEYEDAFCPNCYETLTKPPFTVCSTCGWEEGAYGNYEEKKNVLYEQEYFPEIHHERRRRRRADKNIRSTKIEPTWDDDKIYGESNTDVNWISDRSIGELEFSDDDNWGEWESDDDDIHKTIILMHKDNMKPKEIAKRIGGLTTRKVREILYKYQSGELG